MSGIFEQLAFYFEYPFVRYAMIVGVLIALCSSLLGVTLVLKRFSFIGDGLSHVAFGAIAIGAVLNLTDEMLIVAPVTIICAVLLLRTGQDTRIKGDAAIAMISVGALAIGYLLMNIFSTSPNISGDVCSTLFGSTSILTLTETEVWLCVFMSALVVAIFVLFYNKIFAVTFDEDFAEIVGEKKTLLASNIASTKTFQIETPDVVVKVNPERSDLVETREIDGRRCLVIAIDDHLEVNGIEVRK